MTVAAIQVADQHITSSLGVQYLTQGHFGMPTRVIEPVTFRPFQPQLFTFPPQPHMTCTCDELLSLMPHSQHSWLAWSQRRSVCINGHSCLPSCHVNVDLGKRQVVSQTERLGAAVFLFNSANVVFTALVVWSAASNSTFNVQKVKLNPRCWLFALCWLFNWNIYFRCMLWPLFYL